MKITQLLEGIHDPHQHKVIFMLGGPGSGKTHVARKLVGGTGLKMVNVDDVYEFLRNKTGIQGAGFDDELYKYSGNVTQRRMNNYVAGGLGMVIDGTGRHVDRLQQTKNELEEIGYDVMAVFVNTDVLTALDRNDERRRKVNPQWLRKVHDELRMKMGELQRIFNNNLLVIDNTTKNQDLGYYQKKVDGFINAPARVTEDVDDQAEADLYKEWTQKIIKECQPFLKEMGSPLVPLYRGRQEPTKGKTHRDPFITPYRKNRNPVDSSSMLQGIFNRIIEKNGGIANRSNAIFTTGDRNTATGYGYEYVIFPRGEFHYTYNTAMRDWFTTNNSFSEFVIKQPSVVLPSGWAKLNIPYNKALEKVIDSIYFVANPEPVKQITNKLTNDLSKSISILGKYREEGDPTANQLLMSFRHFWLKELTINDINIDAVSKIKQFDKVSDNMKADEGLSQAALSKNEIMISAKEGYIHIPISLFNKYVQPYLEHARYPTKTV